MMRNCLIDIRLRDNIWLQCWNNKSEPQGGGMRPDDGEDSGCAFLSGADGAPLACGAPRRPGSSFCPEHHALCHLPPGGRAERREIALEEALARAVGGRLGREAREPPDALLLRLDRISRLFF
jgi:hypothetical protein